MSLFISNATKQNVVFNFREPRDNLLSNVEIARGGQVEVGHAWNTSEKEKVIAQLERFGARDAAEVYGKLEGFLGLLYRDGAPVASDEITMGHAAVVDTQEHRAATEATRAALGFDRAINRGGRGHRAARMTEVTVEEQIPRHGRPTGKEVAFSLAVDPDGRVDANLPA